ncbi:DUF2780 domain-containing protein [Photobacterium indicum]|uniref:DUF2780 domain-containing protein n=1 Tax=Photobacterium indicum TaxID=81447 RepID=A0A2T3L163_9GAMM|nr:DUF2780 domain-containing protein [Photobacterium indicum]PSV42078.1 hypothetical protein C9J47_26210 [Photobacterium indicum]
MDNIQKVTRRFFSLTTLFVLLVSSPVSMAFSLSDIFGGGDEEQASVATNPLTELLAGQLGVSTEQAAGGAGALLSMASSQLSGDQATELANMIPGGDALTSAIPAGLGGLLGNTEGLNQVFSALGMDASMVSQFIPVVLQFVGDQGASAGLVEALGKVWSPTS